MSWLKRNKKTFLNIFTTGDIILVKKENTFMGFKTISKGKWRHSGHRSLHRQCESLSRWI